jgi:hypothetical protein
MHDVVSLLAIDSNAIKSRFQSRLMFAKVLKHEQVTQ